MGYVLQPTTTAARESLPLPVHNSGETAKTEVPEIFTVNSGRRFYSPELGRWLSRDPIHSLAINDMVDISDSEIGTSTLNAAYGFTGNSAIIFVDIDGRMAFPDTSSDDDQENRDALNRFIRIGNMSIIYDSAGVGHAIKNGRYTVDRCNIVILFGHGSYLPSLVDEEEGAAGCAFASAYGCFSGGGVMKFRKPLAYDVMIPATKAPYIPGAPRQPTEMIGEWDLADDVAAAFSAALVHARQMCGRGCCCKTITVRTVLVGPRVDFFDPALELRVYDRVEEVSCP